MWEHGAGIGDIHYDDDLNRGEINVYREREYEW